MSSAQFGGFLPREGESGASGYRAEAPTVTSFQSGAEFQQHPQVPLPAPNTAGVVTTYDKALSMVQQAPNSATAEPPPVPMPAGSSKNFSSFLFRAGYTPPES